MNYRWILFDADDTLFHFDAYQGLRRMFAGHAVDFTEADYARYQEVNKLLWLAYQDGRIGAAELEGIENHLTALVGAQPVRFDTPGWIARDVGESA